MIIFVVAEIMFFAALMSAHTIARATVLGGVWPPAGQPRLPVERTAFNTAILLLSGALLFVANRRARRLRKGASLCSGRYRHGNRLCAAAGSGMGRAPPRRPDDAIQHARRVFLFD